MWQNSTTHWVELYELGNLGHAHHGDGLVHAPRLSAHIPLTCCRELSNVLHQQQETILHVVSTQEKHTHVVCPHPVSCIGRGVASTLYALA